MPTCDSCNTTFPNKILIDGKMRHLYTRRYCLACSPFGAHNTSRLTLSKELQEHQAQRLIERRRDWAQRATKRRQNMKLRAVVHKGGCCSTCGYNRCVAALEFHHREPEQKNFSVAVGSMWKWETLEAELKKCDLLCANCHREAEDASAIERSLRRTKEIPIAQQRVEKRRRDVALKAVALLGGCCAVCGYNRCVRTLEFHHVDASAKAFQVRNGNTWGWARVQAELEKCILLCANCHREAEAADSAQVLAASTCGQQEASA